LKIVIMYGATDWIIDPIDARRLICTLRYYGLDVADYQVPTNMWNHLDFVIGTGAGELVYDETVRLLDLYSWVE